jgi:hypothetical protein
MDDATRCTATAKSTGERCKQKAIPGGDVCRYHGGNAEQVQEKAQDRLDDVFDRMDDADTNAEYVKLLREARQLTTAILDRTGHGPSETREVTGEGGGPLMVLETDGDDSE